MAVLTTLAPVPAGLYEQSWSRAAHEGRLDVVELPSDAICIDCGTPAQYLEANLHWSGGKSVVGSGAAVRIVFDDPAARTNIGIIIKKGSPLKAQLTAAIKWYLGSAAYRQNAAKWKLPTYALLKK